MLAFIAAGIVALIAISVDFYSEMSVRFGTRVVRRSALAVRPPGIALFLIGWSLVCVGFAIAIFEYPDWANRAFNVQIGENRLEAGLLIGCSALILIRSQLGKAGNISLGFELPYSWTRDLAIEAWHHERGEARDRLLTSERAFFSVVRKYPTYGSSLHSFLVNCADALPSGEKGELGAELQAMLSRGSVEGLQSRKALVGFAFDHFGHKRLNEWAQRTDRGNNDPNLPEP